MPVPRSVPDEVVLTTPASVRRRHELRMLGLFVLLALPVAAVVWLLVTPGVAVLYVVAQTLFLWFGLRRRHAPVLRLDAEGISYEPGQFQIRCTWADVDALGTVDLPDSGRVEALLLAEGHLHWASDEAMRRQVRARGWDKVVPIETFEPEWEWGEIGAAFRQWAPWIFELPEADDRG